MSETKITDHSDSTDSVATFMNENPTFIIRSLGPGGFDEVTRPDSRSAEEAAEVHERATGNKTETEVRYR